MKQIHFYCSKCRTIASTREKLFEHLKNVHHEAFQCEFCSKMFERKSELKLHLGQKHSKERPEFILQNKNICDGSVLQCTTNYTCDGMQCSCVVDTSCGPSPKKGTSSPSHTSPPYFGFLSSIDRPPLRGPEPVRGGLSDPQPDGPGDLLRGRLRGGGRVQHRQNMQRDFSKVRQ